MKKLIEKYGKKNLIIFCVAVLIAIIVIPTGVKCIVNQQSPAQLFSDAFTPNEEQIIGKWQGETAVTAYEFYADGTYDSYISSFSYKGKYDIESNKITLTNSSLSGSVTYKYSIKGDKLTMKLIKENGIDAEEQTKSTYTKVDKITMQSISDIFSELTTESEE